MKIQNNPTIYPGDSNRAGESQKINDSKNGDGKSVFAGDLNLPADKVSEKQKQAHEQALKLIMNAFAIDKEIDNGLADRKQRVKDIEASIIEAKNELTIVNEERESLKKIYGLDDENTQENLKILERYQKDPNRENFTKDELERLDYIFEDGRLLEYQERIRKLDERQQSSLDIKQLESKIKMENAIITATKLARNQLRHMLDATESAEDILKAASGEIIGMISKDSITHIKDESEKQEKQAGEVAEKQKKQREFIEKIKESKEDNSYYISEITQNILTLDKDINIQAEAKKIISKLNLIEDDIKGTVVNQVS
ncbi:MAG: hypothetical protein FWE14_04700 [Lachnospiraceae bacterium]|nr:hypothetical protein [Lachnospiraceae bacterium]